MLDAGRSRISHRSMLVVAAVSLFLLVGLVGVVLVNGSSSSPLRPANAAAECDTPTGPTARGYGETGTGLALADPDCEPACDPAAADGPTARGYGESGAANVVPSCGPCPSDPPGATGRGYGESGVGGVLSDGCPPSGDASSGHAGATVAPAVNDGDGPTGAAGSAATAPLTGGGGAHGGDVPGATGRAAPRAVDATDHGVAAGEPLSTPLSAVVAQAPSAEGGRGNTGLVVGGLALLLVAVAVVLRRGRPGTAW